MKLKEDYELYGIVGYPLSHTLSPVMQETAFRELGLKHFYLPVEMTPNQFQKVMRAKNRFPLTGFNITVPYKEKMIRYLDRVRSEVEFIGAVNTVYRHRGKWQGANTDADGFFRSLTKEGRFQPRGKQALVLGAGGSARAVIYTLIRSGMKRVVIANRHPERAKRIVRQFKKLSGKVDFEIQGLERKKLRREIANTDLIINTTSVGLRAKDKALLHASDIPAVRGKTKKLFFDLIYNPSQTRFLKLAKAKGHRVLNGTGMLAAQGAKSFELWTNRKAPLSLMRRTLEKALKRG